MAFAACLAGQAAAGTRSLTDPDDGRGRLDVALIRHGHGSSEDILLHRISTHDRWRDRALGANGRGDIRLVFSILGDRCAEKVIWLSWSKGRLKAYTQDYNPVGCGPYDDVGGSSIPPEQVDARIWRPDRRSIALSFPRSVILGRTDHDYRWSIQTRWRSDGCPRTSCYDAAPAGSEGKRGILRHIL
jgi:hypothetical protein